MIVVIVALLALLAFGAVLTRRMWPQHNQVGVARRLAVLWVGIGLAIIVIVGATTTSTGIFAFIVFRWFAGLLSDIGVPEPLADVFAALAAVPIAIAIPFAFSLRQRNRRIGVALLFMAVAAFSFARFAYEDVGYTILPNGYVQRCWTPGRVDRGSGQPCIAMTPVIRQFLDWSPSLIGLLFVEHPDAFFDPATNAPLVWYCERTDGSVKFVRIPIFDPMTGKPCKPVTKEIVERTGGVATESAAAGGSLIVRQPITIPFREDYSDGDYHAFNLTGGLSLVPCGEKRCLCKVGTGPWTMTLNIPPTPFYAASVNIEIFGEGWQLAIAYMDGARELLRATHNWRVEGAASSCIGTQCRHPVALGVGWHRISLIPKWRMKSNQTSGHDESRQEQFRVDCGLFDLFTCVEWRTVTYRVEGTSWASLTFTETLLATAMTSGATARTLAEDTLFWHSGHLQNGMHQAAAAAHEATSMLVTVRQPYETRFCISAVEVQPVAEHDGTQ